MIQSEKILLSSVSCEYYATKSTRFSNAYINHERDEELSWGVVLKKNNLVQVLDIIQEMSHCEKGNKTLSQYHSNFNKVYKE